MTDETETFDVDAALNRVVGAVTEHRKAANVAETPAQLILITNLAMNDAMRALGVPLTQELANQLLFAAVLRLADMFNAETETIEIPDHL